MAKTENQGLQVAVIIFAFLTIALSVATFYFFNEYSTQTQNALALNEKATTAERASKQMLDERNALMTFIGFGTDKKLGDVQPQFAKDMGRTMVHFGLKDKTQNYTQAIELMITTLEQLKTETRRENAELTRLTEDIKTLKAAYDKSVVDTKTEYDNSVKQFIDRTTVYTTTDQQHVTEVKRLTGDLDKKREELAKMINDKTNEIQKIQSDLQKAIADAAKANDIRYEVLNQTFDRPDGKIVAVNPKENSVWIDVGRNDHLRLNLRFTVFERGENNVHKRVPKGTIEVKKFLGESMAEANIVEAILKNPILEGDVIATPTWKPGEPERFVLAGDFDVNGDRKPDNDLVKQLVGMGGGTIDTELSIDTRYLLLGSSPAEKPAADEYTKLHNKAKQLHIKVMTLQEFLDYTGTRDLLRRATALSGASQETSEALKTRNELEGKQFKSRTPDDGARRLEPGATPKGGRDPGPDRRPGPGAPKSGGGSSAPGAYRG